MNKLPLTTHACFSISLSSLPLARRRKRRTLFLTSLLLLCVVGMLPVGASAQSSREEKVLFFESKVRPILYENCFGCHSEKVQSGGLRLDTQSAMFKGGASGTAVVPGDVEKSLLIQAVRYQGKRKMPPSGPLNPAQVAILEKWVKDGAIWPNSIGSQAGASGQPLGGAKTPAKKTVVSGKGTDKPQGNKLFWSLCPVAKVAVPRVKNAAWVKNPIDAFVLSKLEGKGLTPAPPADKRTLLRRVTFDLTGLPPAPKEVAEFLSDKSPNAYEKVVDRLLASPRYGERWGRHWLDVVRYADSYDARGYGSEGDISEAWRYRDWVVNALNADMPYSEFMMNQVAGDLLDLPQPVPGKEGKPTVLAPSANKEGIIATGMLAIGNWGNGDADKEKILTDIADDQVDVISRGFMGLTVACARCHDHKFDPITTKDYYGLAGIFFSTRILPKMAPKGAGESPLRVPVASPADMEKRKQFEVRTTTLEKQLKEAETTANAAFAKTMLSQTSRYMLAAWEYRTRPAERADVKLADFARERKLIPYALRQWSDYLAAGDGTLLANAVKDVAGNEGVLSWHGESTEPSLIINTTGQSITISTLTLPTISVAVHPGPKSGVVCNWRSPIDGVVKVLGRVTDADPHGGDGIAWKVSKRTTGGTTDIANGQIPDGGVQNFMMGQNARDLNSIPVKVGDVIQVTILPKESYYNDTTLLEMVVAERDGGYFWNMNTDVLTYLRSKKTGNPFSDKLGHPDVWRFTDAGDSSQRGEGFPALDAWEKAVAEYDAERTKRPAQMRVPALYQVRVESAAEDFQKQFALTDRRSPFFIRNEADWKDLPDSVRTPIETLRKELLALRQSAPPPPVYANAVQDGGVPGTAHEGVHDVKVHIRGSYARLGDMVPRHFPVVLAGENQKPITQGSGRIELARWLASDTHPLTARVIVNRLWQGHFGEGIVRTPSNFGLLGDRPSHPELLDWLAGVFSGQWSVDGSSARQPATDNRSLTTASWSLKAMHRLMLLSNTYQQASQSGKLAPKLDPDNRLFGRMNRRRLEAEAVRDSLLAVTGELDTTMGGPATREFTQPRRTLYVATIRSDKSGFGTLFDVADSNGSVEKRTVSTVAPQALFLLNHPFALARAKALAARLIREAKSDAERIAVAYQTLYGRPASSDEVKIGLRMLSGLRSGPAVQNASLNGESGDIRAWEAYAQILLCANEFLFVD